MIADLAARFTAYFAKAPQCFFSAPGRTELGGNHTDHQHGLVLAAAVDLDVRAAVAANDLNSIRVFSEGYPLCTVTLPAGAPLPGEYGSSTALIRGVAARFAQLGKKVCGFDAYVASDVHPGSGLSSSAAFEVLMGVILNHLGDCGLTAPEIAEIGQYAENVYFGKPCGLMDQMTSAVGGVISIDFADPKQPRVTPIAFDLDAHGYALCIVNTGADHVDLTNAYVAIPAELREISHYFGKEYLRDVAEADFFRSLQTLRKQCGDRAVLRAIHVFEENRRVLRQIAALERNDLTHFLAQVDASGRSSWTYLQNVIPEGQNRCQELALALALAQRLLDGHGACRVHGGGFAGTIQAFVPLTRLSDFSAGMEAVFGKGCCRKLSIRPIGGILLHQEDFI